MTTACFSARDAGAFARPGTAPTCASETTRGSGLPVQPSANLAFFRPWHGPVGPHLGNVALEGPIPPRGQRIGTAPKSARARFSGYDPTNTPGPTSMSKGLRQIQPAEPRTGFISPATITPRTLWSKNRECMMAMGPKQQAPKQATRRFHNLQERLQVPNFSNLLEK